MLAEWRAAIDGELRSPDSEFDKTILATAYAVIDVFVGTVMEIGTLPEEQA